MIRGFITGGDAAKMKVIKYAVRNAKGFSLLLCRLALNTKLYLLVSVFRPPYLYKLISYKRQLLFLNKTFAKGEIQATTGMRSYESINVRFQKGE